MGKLQVSVAGMLSWVMPLWAENSLLLPLCILKDLLVDVVPTSFSPWPSLTSTAMLWTSAARGIALLSSQWSFMGLSAVAEAENREVDVRETVFQVAVKTL